MRTSFFILGEGPLAMQCLATLSERGHATVGVISDDAALQDAAQSEKIKTNSANCNLLDVLNEVQFDYLISIVWRSILTPEMLALPKRLAINYHDSPLPKYAGTHATPWALISQEKVHAVTWHVMEQRIDSGDILIQQSVPISNDDTTRSLDLKCLAAGIQSFGNLLGEIEQNNCARRPQDIGQRTYFPNNKRPQYDGLINWEDSAKDIDALLRALCFGARRTNDFSIAKIYTGKNFIVVKSHQLGKPTDCTPGTILNLTNNVLTICTGDTEIELTEFESCQGEPLSLAEIVKIYNWAVGQILPSVKELNPELGKLQQRYAKFESYWRQQLSNLQAIDLPLPATIMHVDAEPSWLSVPLELTQLDKLSTMMSCIVADVSPAVFLLYLARLSRQLQFHVSYQAVEFSEHISGLYAISVPLFINLSSGVPAILALKTVHQSIASTVDKGSYLVDLFARDDKLLNSMESLKIHLASGPPSADSVHCLHLAIASEPTLYINSTIVSKEIASSVTNGFAIFLDDLIRNPSQFFDTLKIISDSDLQLITQTWNNFHNPNVPMYCVHQLIEAQARQNPDNISVIEHGVALSYSTLNSKANGLAETLIERGVGRGDRIAVMMDASIDIVVSYLAIMKTGAAFTPLDAAWPQHRVKELLKEIDPACILISSSTESEPLSMAANVISVDHHLLYSQSNVNALVEPTDPMYIVFTSGSTGIPKGAINTHCGAANRFIGASDEWHQHHLGAELRLLVTAAPTFDPSIRQFLWPLTHGGCCIIPTHQVRTNIGKLPGIVVHEQISSFSLVTTLFKLLIEHLQTDRDEITLLRSVKHIYVGGERIEARVFSQFRALCPWIKLSVIYGPSESAMGVLSYHADEDNEDPLPVGRPLPNVRAYILDKHMHAVPPYLIGELCIGGVQVGLGYLNDKMKTDAAFTVNPFSTTNERMYRTGDIAYFRADGQIIFVGRTDEQIKINGVRIELGEITTTLCAHPDVSEGWVRVDISLGFPQLIGYAVARQGATISPDMLFEYIRARLPSPSIPKQIMILDSFPKLPSGKINSQLLPEPPSIDSQERTNSGFDDPIEEQIRKIWLEVSNNATIDRTANLLDNSADSLTFMQMLNRFRATMNVSLTIVDMLDNVSIAELAVIVKNRQRYIQ